MAAASESDTPFRHGFKTLSFRILRSKYDIRVIGGSTSGNALEASGDHCLIITYDASPANTSATNIIDSDDDNLHCSCRNIDYGEMIGCDGPDCETEWFYFACVEIDLKAKPEGVRFCKSCRLGKDPRTGKKVDGRVQRAVEVIGVVGVVGRRVRVVAQGGTGGLNNGVSFKVSRGDPELNTFLLTTLFAAQ